MDNPVIPLTCADEYPIHQSPEPIAVSGTDPNFYDRYFFNAYSKDGTRFIAAAMGIYPHQNIIDAAFSLIDGGVQHCVFASRRLNFERMDTEVAPIGVEVIEPLKKIRLRVAENASGVAAELVFSGRASPIQEPRFTWRMGTRTIMDCTRMTQNVDCSGWISVNGERFEIADWWGTRDRSWGVRSIGGANKEPFPPDVTPQFFWRWSPMNFDGHLIYFHTNDDACGEPWNRSGIFVPLGGEPRELIAPELETIYLPGTRHAASARFSAQVPGLGKIRVDLKPERNFYMRGVGYMHKEWGHGGYHGEYATHHERYDLGQADNSQAENNYIQALCQATLTLPDGTVHAGRAVLEQLSFGPYAPHGFKEFLDVA